MMVVMKRWLVAAGIVAVAVVSGCGGGGGSEDTEAAYAAAIGESMRASAGDEFPVSESEARCVGDGFVNIVGVETFEDAGISPDDIRQDPDRDLDELIADPTPEQADDLVDVIFECVDIGAVFAAGFEASAAEDDVQIPQDKVECIAQNFERNERLRDLFATSILEGSDPDFDEGGAELLGEILGDCLSVADLLDIGLQLDESSS
jgi:hypothetical protein